MNNSDMQQLMSILSKMDKKELEAGINQVSRVLNTNNQEQIINAIKKNGNKR